MAGKRRRPLPEHIARLLDPGPLPAVFARAHAHAAQARRLLAHARLPDKVVNAWRGHPYARLEQGALNGTLLEAARQFDPSYLRALSRREADRRCAHFFRVLSAAYLLEEWSAATQAWLDYRDIDYGAHLARAEALGRNMRDVDDLRLAHRVRTGAPRRPETLASKVERLYRERVIEGGEPPRGFATRLRQAEEVRASKQAINRIIRTFCTRTEPNY